MKPEINWNLMIIAAIKVLTQVALAIAAFFAVMYATLYLSGLQFLLLIGVVVVVFMIWFKYKELEIKNRYYK